MAFPTNRQIIETVVKESGFDFKPDAVESIIAEVERRIARKPDINMLGLLTRVIRNHAEVKDGTT